MQSSLFDASWKSEIVSVNSQSPKSIRKEVESKNDRCIDAYLAGIMDGEGYICVSYRSNARKYGRSGHFQLRVSVQMCDIEPLVLFQTKYGGKTWTQPKTYQPNKRIAHRWTVYDANAMNALISMRQFLTVKAARADLAIDFQSHRMSGGRLNNGRYPPLSQEEFKRRFTIMHQIHLLNSDKNHQRKSPSF